MLSTMGLKIAIVSGDPAVGQLCRDVLREFPRGRWEVAIQADPVLRSDYSLRIWDYKPGLKIGGPAHGGNPKDLYLVSSSELPLFREEFPFIQDNILLKPVTRAILLAFLGLCLPSATDTAAGSAQADRDDVLQSLLQANLRLQEYDQQRTNFISRVVHDFRAPLTAISGFCKLLANEELGSLGIQQKDVIRRMQRSAERTLKMAASMFDLSLSNRVTRTPRFENADILASIEQAVHELRPSMNAKKIVFSAPTLAAPAGPLYFEPTQIEQALVNLLDNACRVTPPGGFVGLSGYPYFWERRFLESGSAIDRRRAEVRQPNSYRVDVIDSGPGIPAEHVERIFEEYATGPTCDTSNGGGLGLAICRLILNRHQGRVWTDQFHNGAVFSFVLPH